MLKATKDDVCQRISSKIFTQPLSSNILKIKKIAAYFA
jgi:hypothetical protein